MNASSNDHSNAPPTDSEASSTRIDKPNQAKPGYMTRSSSYIEPRTFEMYAQYLDPVKKMQGVVEKQSRKCPNVWKKRWMYMSDNGQALCVTKKALTYDTETEDDDTAVKMLPFSAIQSIQTLKRLGNAVFQLKCSDRHDVVYRFQDQDQMNDWLFEFQRSIAKIVHWIWKQHRAQERPAELDRVGLRRHDVMSSSSSSIEAEHVDETTQGPVVVKRTALHRSMSLDNDNGGPSSDNDHDDAHLSFTNDNTTTSMSSSTMTRPLAIHLGNTNPTTHSSSMILQRSSPTSQLLSSSDYMASISPTSPLHQGLRSMKEELEERFHQATSFCLSSSSSSSSLSPERSSKPDDHHPELMQFELDCHEEEEESKSKSKSKSKSLEEEERIPQGNIIAEHKVGWTSLVGNRKSNEDVCCCIENLAQYLESAHKNSAKKKDTPTTSTTNHSSSSSTSRTELQTPQPLEPYSISSTVVDHHHQIDQLYGVFDGHSGALAADFVKEHLPPTLAESPYFHTDLSRAFRETFASLDAAFLEEVNKVDRYDGTTVALVLLRGSSELWTANIGDSKAVMGLSCCQSDDHDRRHPQPMGSRSSSTSDSTQQPTTTTTTDVTGDTTIDALDIIVDQTPGRPDERARIEAQGGWVTEERELQMSRLHSMDLQDPEIRQEALEQVVKWITIYRVNGELAVSRSIGDPDYKHPGLNSYPWAYPPDHEHHPFPGSSSSSSSSSSSTQGKTSHFTGGSDLVISVPEVRRYNLEEVSGEFIILASDGLWDVVESQKAVEFVANWRELNPDITPEEASAKLAALALRLGSADNVSVLIVFLQFVTS